MMKMPEQVLSKATAQVKEQVLDDSFASDWDGHVERNKSNIWSFAQALERFSERETHEFDEYLEQIHDSLIDVPEITLRDLFLVDMLDHSIEATPYRHTMTIKSLLSTYKMIFRHLDILRSHFPPFDPVIQIIENLGKTEAFIP